MSKYEIKMVLEGESAADVYADVAKALFLGELDPSTLIVQNKGPQPEEPFEFPAVQSAIRGLSHGTE